MTPPRRRRADEPWRRIYGTENWKRARRNARRRAGGLCERCGDEPETLDVHHRIPLKDGGAPFDPDNLVVLCRPCHRALERTEGSFFEGRNPHLPPVGFPSPIRQAVGRLPESQADPPDKWRRWMSPDGLRWSRNWDGTGIWMGDAPPPDPPART